MFSIIFQLFEVEQYQSREILDLKYDAYDKDMYFSRIAIQHFFMCKKCVSMVKHDVLRRPQVTGTRQEGYDERSNMFLHYLNNDN